MSEESKSSISSEQVRQVMRDWETYKMPDDPDFARTYAGEWVVIHRGRVLAHGTDVTEVAKVGNVREFPGAEMFRVPALDKQEGVWLLGDSHLDA